MWCPGLVEGEGVGVTVLGTMHAGMRDRKTTRAVARQRTAGSDRADGQGADRTPVEAMVEGGGGP